MVIINHFRFSLLSRLWEHGLAYSLRAYIRHYVSAYLAAIAAEKGIPIFLSQQQKNKFQHRRRSEERSFDQLLVCESDTVFNAKLGSVCNRSRNSSLQTIGIVNRSEGFVEIDG